MLQNASKQGQFKLLQCLHPDGDTALTNQDALECLRLVPKPHAP